MARVKLCGNTDAAQIALCARAGADAVGIVVEYPVPVPWNLTRAAAGPLLCAVPPFISRVVVTGGSPDDVCDIAESLRPHLLQLHTDNPPEEVARIASRLRSLGIGLIAALRIDVATGRSLSGMRDPVDSALALQDAGVDAVLLDATTARMPAGTGERVDWEMARRARIALSIPLVLAGGLSPDNVRRAIEQVRPFAVDVITGVEASRTVKDPERVHAFVREVRAAGGSGEDGDVFVDPLISG